MIPLKTIVEPATEPISLVEAKAHCHAGDDEDAVLAIYIAAARQRAEFVTGRRFITQTVERILDAFPSQCGGIPYTVDSSYFTGKNPSGSGDIELPGSPIQSVTSVRYLEAVAGVDTLLPGTDYVLDAENEPGWLLPAFGKTWPATYATALAVRVRYVVGWAGAAQVPANLRYAILVGVGEAYLNREESTAVDFNPCGRFSVMLQKHRLNLGL